MDGGFSAEAVAVYTGAAREAVCSLQSITYSLEHTRAPRGGKGEISRRRAARARESEHRMNRRGKRKHRTTKRSQLWQAQAQHCKRQYIALIYPLIRSNEEPCLLLIPSPTRWSILPPTRFLCSSSVRGKLTLTLHQQDHIVYNTYEY